MRLLKELIFTRRQEVEVIPKVLRRLSANGSRAGKLLIAFRSTSVWCAEPVAQVFLGASPFRQNINFLSEAHLPFPPDPTDWNQLVGRYKGLALADPGPDHLIQYCGKFFRTWRPGVSPYALTSRKKDGDRTISRPVCLPLTTILLRSLLHRATFKASRTWSLSISRLLPPSFAP